MKRILCKTFGHRYYVYAKPEDSWSDGIKWLKCSRCKQNFTINDRVKILLPPDFELMDIRNWIELEKEGKKC